LKASPDAYALHHAGDDQAAALLRKATVATMSSGFLTPDGEKRCIKKSLKQKTAMREMASEKTKPALRETNTTTTR